MGKIFCIIAIISLATISFIHFKDVQIWATALTGAGVWGILAKLEE
jgi:hypothetical protein